MNDTGLDHAGRHQASLPIADDAGGVRKPESAVLYVQDNSIARCPDVESAQVACVADQACGIGGHHPDHIRERHAEEQEL